LRATKLRHASGPPSWERLQPRALCNGGKGKSSRLKPLPQEQRNRTSAKPNPMPASFLFYDLETFGTDPRRSRIAQFAAIRTDARLNEVEAPVEFFVQPADDLLPSPMATLVTGITPQDALRDGIPEAEAFARIAEEM